MEESEKTSGWASFDWGGLLAVAATIGFAIFIFYRIDVFSAPASFGGLALLALSGLIAAGLGFAVRQLMPLPRRMPASPPNPAGPFDPKPDGNSRDRIAILAFAIGGGGIIGLALILLAAITFLRREELTTTGLSVFTSTLPVFSTWVGTVLAFYFTNESFRQAAATAHAAVNTDDSLEATRAGTMVPYAQIVRYDMKPDPKGRDAKVAAEDILISEIQKLFKPPGIMRAVIFDDKKIPVFIIRHDKSFDDNSTAAATLKTYLANPAARDAASNFSWTSASASISDVRRLLQLRRVTDVFITQNGRNDEPTLGWIPDINVTQAPGQS